MRVVIDTNIIVKAIEDGEPEHTMTIHLVIYKRHKLVLDYENKLLEEYRDNLQNRKLFQKWFKTVEIASLIEWSDGHLSQTHTQNLTRLGLHEEEDHVIVALAWHTDKYVVTEDSDFGKGGPARAQSHLKALNYLTNTMGLTIHSAVEALTQLDT